MVVDITAGNGNVPAALPSILKSFTKAAIRTQPSDIISWSNIYFQALADGETLPVKDQLEFPVPKTASGLSPGALRTITKLIETSKLQTLPSDQYQEVCKAFGGNMSVINPIGDLVPDLPDEGGDPWSGTLSELIKVDEAEKGIVDKLTLAMKVIAKDPIEQKVSVENVFVYFDLLHSTEGSTEGETLHQEVKDYLKDVASYQEGFLTPEDLARPSCPIHKIV